MNHHIKQISIAVLLASMSLLLVVPAYALAGAASSTKEADRAAEKAAVQLPLVIQKGDADIAARITSLNDLNTRTLSIKNISDTERQTLTTVVQQNIDGLTALKSKIDADTDLPTAQDDTKSIFTTFRIYALVIPQGWILASTDRVTTITDLMTNIASQVQSRIATEQGNGKDVTALTAALTDMNAKIADAKTQSTAAQSGVSVLVPDGGDKTVAAANHTALITARTAIKTATTDLQAARKDITTLIQGLKMLDGTIQASSTATH